jgi:hypothetical protein
MSRALLQQGDGLALDCTEAEFPSGGQRLAEQFPGPVEVG